MKDRKIIPDQAVNCFRCQKKFFIKYVLPHKRYSQKNDWDFWTGETGGKKICDSCLISFYSHEKFLFWEKVPDLKKRHLLRNYITNQVVRA
ncbi:MAG: hypothetical protein MRERV_12c045 [Mycoplasmataceae bacterium RV_VA103A]|nr:MAG: hypothetical protein MRERV_12c045 [Mycoplasmataceae bacterium RV_VA103A]